MEQLLPITQYDGPSQAKWDKLSINDIISVEENLGWYSPIFIFKVLSKCIFDYYYHTRAPQHTQPHRTPPSGKVKFCSKMLFDSTIPLV